MSAPVPAPPTPAWKLYRAVVGVALVCGAAIVGAYTFTAPFIRQNQVEARQAAVLQVLPGATRSATFRFAHGRFAPAADDADGADLVFAGYDDAGALVGVAAEGAGMGYQDTVRLIWGLDLDAQAVVGMRVLESRETPGLGTRVETDPAFLANFRSLDVTVQDGAMAHPITAVKAGQKQNPWEIDCITGATITSTAVADILRDSTSTWVPRVLAGRADLQQGAAP